MKKNTAVVIAVCWMLIVVVFATASITIRFVGALPEGMLLSSAAAQSEEGGIASRYARLDEVRRILQSKYYQELDEDQLVLGAIRGMLSATDDPYTYYYTPEEHEENLRMMSGAYEGIGLDLSADEHDMLTILRVFPGTPARDAGILPGDRIVKVNGTDVGAKTLKDMDSAINIIKTAENPLIELTLLRDDELVDVEVRRAKINSPSTEHRMIDDEIGLITIFRFMGSDVSEFDAAVADLRSQGMKALAIDVRNNPGGLLYDVVTICDKLLPEGLVVYTEDRSGKREDFASDADAIDLPMAVIVNSMSASASEVLAGALQDYGVATIVGETTFGKGIVQEEVPFQSDGASMQLTISTYFTPKGRSIHGEGIVPDVEVELPEDVDYVTVELHPERDTQLQTAIRILCEQLSNR